MALIRPVVPTVAVALLLAACVGGPGARTAETSIDRSFTPTGFRWAEGGLVRVFLKARPSQGKVEICAAWMFDGGPYYTFRLNQDVLQAATVRIDGDRVMTGLGFAHELPQSDVVVGQQANCARGGAPWKPSYATAPAIIELPRLRFIG